MDSISYDYNANDYDKSIPFGKYLLSRLVRCGSRSIFGVPGDYNLPLLEYLYKDSVKETGCRWIGCCNELNAAYAADGYSRYTNGLAAVITTYGVGELSAINGLAGSSAENVKVLHIVGVVKDGAPAGFNYHHMIPQLQYSNLVGPDRKASFDMVKHKIACSAEYLEDIETAVQKFEKVIRDIYRYSKPGYLFVPADFFDKLVDITNLKNEINLNNSLMKTPSEVLNRVSEHVLEWIYRSSTPGILADVNVDRFGLISQLNDFIEKTHMISFSTIMGKSIVDETNSNYMGLYAGENSAESVRRKFLCCDLILHFGVEKNEVNYCVSGFYGSKTKVIEFHQSYVRFWDTGTNEEQLFKSVNFVDVLADLKQRINLDNLDLQYDKSIFITYDLSQLKLPNDDKTNLVTQVYLQKKFPEILNPGDVLISDTGCFQFGVRDYKLPSQSKLITQGIWLSIGMSLPAALGVGIGIQDYPRSHILDQTKVSPDYEPKLVVGVGDGAAQMTVQELTTILRYQVPIKVFIWNNSGYTIERALMNEKSSYNNIMPWKWTKLFEVFGDFEGKYSESSLVKTRQELDQKIEDINTIRKGGKNIQLIEVKLGIADYPTQLQMIVTNSKKVNK